MDPKKLQGFETPDDKKVPVRTGDWNALKRAVWRSKTSWEIVTREAESIVESCRHSDECLAKTIETKACLHSCPDREKRLSALVILNAARDFAPIDAKKIIDGQYFAPSREHFSAVLSELAAAQLELAQLRAMATKETP